MLNIIHSIRYFGEWKLKNTEIPHHCVKTESVGVRYIEIKNESHFTKD